MFSKRRNKHIAQIRKVLSISADAEVRSWRYSARTPNQQGTQIDLLFDRANGVVTICEIKYNDQPFAIDKNYSKNLLKKMEIYRKQTRTSKQMFLAMVTANGIKSTLNSEEIVSGTTILEDLFVEVD